MTEHQPGAGLARYHAEQREQNRKSILSTMRAIEAEIAERGYYCDPADPDKVLTLSMAEVLRRSGLKPDYLRNKRNHDLRNIVQDWLHVQNEAYATRKADAQAIRYKGIQFLEMALAKVSADALTWQSEKAAMQRRIAALEQQIADMTSAGNVVPLKPGERT